MLQNRKPHKIQHPSQAKAPGYKQLETLLGQSQANIGCTIELPFGEGPVTYALTVLCSKDKDESQWMFYKLDRGSSSLEWSLLSIDVNMIHNALCAQFPDVDLNLKASKSAMAAPTSLLLEPGQAVATTSGALPGPQRKTLMEGDIKSLDIATLLQSISMGALTGRMEVVGEKDTAQVYFSEGVLVHCSMRAVEGEAAAMELLGWKSGAYKFFAEKPPEKATVKKRLDHLLMEGVTLVDQQRHLDQLGLTPESFLMRRAQSISEKEFEQIAASGPPAHLPFQKLFYQAVDNRSTLLEILRRCPLPKRDWVPVVFSLIGCELITFRQTLPASDTRAAMAVADIDWSVVRQVEKGLFRSDTEILSYPAFLGILEREQNRYEVLHRPYSLVVLRLEMRKEGDSIEPLPTRGVKEIAQRIEQLKRKCDTLGHFQTFGLALLLPETTSAQANNFARALSDALFYNPPADAKGGLVLGLGLGSVPENCDRLELLLPFCQPKS